MTRSVSSPAASKSDERKSAKSKGAKKRTPAKSRAAEHASAHVSRTRSPRSRSSARRLFQSASVPATALALFMASQAAAQSIPAECSIDPSPLAPGSTITCLAPDPGVSISSFETDTEDLTVVIGDDVTPTKIGNGGDGVTMYGYGRQEVRVVNSGSNVGAIEIYASAGDNGSGDIVISNEGHLSSSGSYGVFVKPYRDGEITITVAGVYASDLSNEDAAAIFVYRSDYDGNVTIDSSAGMVAARRGIVAVLDGDSDGDVSLVVGDVKGVDGRGIDLLTGEQMTSITGPGGAVYGGNGGIDIGTIGGDVSIDDLSSVTAGSGDAIEVTSTGGAISLSNIGSVTTASAGDAIELISSGGDISLQGLGLTGGVYGASGDGILADASGGAGGNINIGDVAVIGEVTGGTNGINAITAGAGNIKIDIGAENVTGETGIRTIAEEGTTEISLISGSTVTGTDGKGIYVSSTQGAITITGPGSIAGGGASDANGIRVMGGLDGVTIDGLASVTSTNNVDRAIEITTSGGNVSLANIDTITGQHGVGIGSGGGDISIQGSGLIGGITGTAGSGIFTDASGGNIAIGTDDALGEVSGAHYGIYAYTYGAGSIAIDSTGGKVTGGLDQGIYAKINGSGSISITTADVETINDENTIEAYVIGGSGDLAIDTRSGKVTNTGISSAIKGQNLGYGALTVTVADIESTGSATSYGLYLTNGGTTLTVDTTAGEIYADGTGIVAENSFPTGVTTGLLSLTVGNIESTAGLGIDARTADGGAIVNGYGSTLTANKEGINVTATGLGDIAVYDFASISSDTEHAVYLKSEYGDISLENIGTISGQDRIDIDSGGGDISLQNIGTISGFDGMDIDSNGGDISVQGSGLTGGITGTNRNGILVDASGGAGGNITIGTADALGNVAGEGWGIYAYTDGAGSIAIDSTGGNVTGGSGGGISARLNGSGSINITTADIATSGSNSEAIYGYVFGGAGDLVIDARAGTLTSNDFSDGIRGKNLGDGALSVTVADIYAGVRGGGGLYLINAGTTLTVDTTAGEIYASGTGIDADNSAASGLLSLTVGNIESTGDLGIDAQTGDGGAIVNGYGSTLTANREGIKVTATGEGDIAVYDFTSISSNTRSGVHLESGYGDISIQDISVHDSGIGAIYARTVDGDIEIGNEQALGAINGHSVGIEARVEGYGNITIDSRGATIYSDYAAISSATGIYVYSATSDTISITTGDVKGAIYVNSEGVTSGITIDTSAGEVLGHTSSVASSYEAIQVYNKGTADISVTVDQVTGKGGIGIVTESGQTDIILSSTAVVTGTEREGIKVVSQGGAVNVLGSSGEIIGATDGLYTRSNGGDIVVDDIDGITGQAGDGVDLGSDGGLIQVTAVDFIIGAGGNGILADAAGGDVFIGQTAAGVDSANGDITASLDGMNIQTDGNGEIVIRSTGTITSGEDGIDVLSGSTGDIDLYSSGNIVTTDGRGIFARNRGTGSVDITSTGNIDASGNRNYGIYAADFYAGDVTVNSSGTIETYGNNADGIYAKDVGDGDADGSVQVTSSGAITTDGLFANGISALNEGAGDIIITNSADVTAVYAVGINARNTGYGALSITSTDGDISGETGIYATTGFYPDAGSGTIDIALGATASITGTSYEGVSATTRGVDSDISLTGANGGESVAGWTDGAKLVTGANDVNSGQLSYADINVGQLSSVTGNYGDALDLSTTGGDINVSDVDSIYAKAGRGTSDAMGIRAITDSGDISIQGTGLGDGVEATYGTGILANAGTGSINIGGTEANGDISGSTYGILATASGADGIVIATTGTVSGGREAITATDSGVGDLSITTAGTVTGNTYGINARNYDGGDLDITATGAVTAARNVAIYAIGTSTNGSVSVVTSNTVTGGGDGIHAINQGAGDLTVDSGGAVSGSGVGIRASNYSGGALTVNAQGAVTGGAAVGILAENNAGDALIITTGTGAIYGGQNGIEAAAKGGGELDITVGGDVTGISGVGIEASVDTNGTDLTIRTTAGTVSGGGRGISAVNNGTGDLLIETYGNVSATFDAIEVINNNGGSLTVNAQGDIYSSDSSGIDAVQNGGDDVTVTTAGTVTGGDGGIHINNYGTGATIVRTEGNVEALGGHGIDVYGYYSSTYVQIDIGSGGVTAADNGVDVEHYGTGSITVSATGDVVGDETGIDIYNETGDGLVVDVQGAVTGKANIGIKVENSASAGQLSITTGAGTVYGGDEGIVASQYGDGDLTISTTGIVAGRINGIAANHYGNGSIIIQTEAAIEGAGYLGIYAYGDNSVTDISVVTGAGGVTGGTNGMKVVNVGDGTGFVSAEGDVIGRSEDGIRLEVSGAGGIVSTDTGSIYGGDEGIDALSYGDGYLTISSNGDVTGGRSGIVADSRGSGDVAITSTADVTGNTGFGINADTDGGAITVSGASTGTVTSNNRTGIKLISRGGDITVSDVATVLGAGGYGINIDSSGGDISVQGSGLVGGITGENGDGIFARSGVGGINLGGIAALGDVTGLNFGIDAAAEGTSDIVVDSSNGKVTATDRDGISIYHGGTGAISITTADVESLGADGIYVYAPEDSDIAIDSTAGTVSGNDDGIYVEHFGYGGVSITTADVTGTTGNGIRATAGGTYLDIDTSAGDVTGEYQGIRALADLNSLITVTAANVSGQTGIYTSAANGDTGISLVSGAIVTGTNGSGIDATARGSGTGSIAVTGAGATVTGTVSGLSLTTSSGDVTVDGLASAQGGITAVRNIAVAGISINTAGGNVSVDAVESAMGAEGISIESGGGDISVQGSGLNGGITGTDGDGILAEAGIGAINLGGIAALGDVTGSERGISASAYGSGDIVIDSGNGKVASTSRAAVRVYHDGTGSISITTADVESLGDHGIYVYAPEDSDIAIDSTAGTVSGNDDGIYVEHFGYGGVSITTADVAGTTGNGIWANAGGTYLDIDTSAGDVTGGDDGILASASVTGSLNITAANVSGQTGIDAEAEYGDTRISLVSGATVTGTNGSGIDAVTKYTGPGSIAVTGAGATVTGTVSGLSLTTTSGDVTVDGLASAVGGTDAGIAIVSDGGNVSVDAVESILGSDGISIASGGGEISVQGSGLIGGITGTDGDGIHAEAGAGSINLGGVTSLGDIIGSEDGIYALVEANGSDLFITTLDGTVSGATSGITALNEGDGAMTIATSDVAASGGSGIYANHSGTGALSIDTTTGSVQGTSSGIHAENDSSYMSVVTTGVTATDGDGIIANNAGTDMLIDTVSGTVTARDRGIFTEHSGTGNLQINADDITASVGIHASSVYSGTINIFLSPTAEVTGTGGSAIYVTPVDGAVTISGPSAQVTGATDGIEVGQRGIGAFPGRDISVTDLDSVTAQAGTALTLHSAVGTTTVANVETVLGTGGNGILIRGYDSDISIQGTGLTGGITGSGGDGINVETATGNVNLGGAEALGTISGSDDGIHAIAGGDEGLVVAVTDDVTGTAGYGIYGLVEATGAGLSVTTGPGSVSGGLDGIRLANEGNGDLSVTTADVTGASGNGIDALNYGSGLLIDSSSGSVSGSATGINADNQGSADMVLTAADVTGGTSAGIYALNGASSGDATIDSTAGFVSGATDGIAVNNQGGGVLTLTTADVTGSSGAGIDAVNTGTNIRIDSTSGAVSGNTAGISADNQNAGVLTLTTADVTGAIGPGIYARNAGTNLEVDSSAGIVSGGTDGIDAENTGTRSLTITTADVTGGTGAGISASNSAIGSDVTISSTEGSVTGGTDGIAANNLGSGALTLTTADVTGTSGNGIYAVNAGTELSIDSVGGAVSGNTTGITADNQGSGDLVLITADVTGTAGAGISALNGATGGDVTVDSSAGSVSAGAQGIMAVQNSVGLLTIIGGTITGSTGIDSQADSGITDITLASGAVVTGTTNEGIAASSNGGEINLFGTAGVVVGATDGLNIASLGGDIAVEAFNSIAGQAGDGIDAVSSGGGIQVTDVGTILGTGGSGVTATSSGGDISVEGSGLVGGITGTNGDGITALAGTGSIGLGTSDANGTILGSVNGIQAVASGDEGIQIVAADVTGTAADGISATLSGSGPLAITATTVEGGESGLYILNSGSGVVSITTETASGGSGDGIYANSTGSDLAFTATGTVAGGENGVLINHFGSGFTRFALADVSGTNADGIAVSTTGTGLDVAASGSVSGGTDGISLINDGTGSTVLDVSGDVTGSDGYGVVIINAASASDVDITSAGVAGASDGIRLEQLGTGSSTITASGPVDGTAGAGMDIRHAGSDLTVTSTDTVAGGSSGIIATSTGSGAVQMSVQDVSGLAGDAVLISQSGTDVVFDASGDLTGTQSGLIVINAGSGVTSIATAGTVTGTSVDGIFVVGGASGEAVDITTNGDVSGGVSGVSADAGSGALTLTIDSDVTGGENGIVTWTENGVQLTVASGQTVTGGTYGIATRTGNSSLTADDQVTIAGTVNGLVSTFEGDDALILSDGGVLNDAVDTGAGDDSFTLASGATALGSIALNAGDDVLNLNGTASGALNGGEGTDTVNFNSTGRILDGSGVDANAIDAFEIYNFNAGGYTLEGTHSGLSEVNFNAGTNAWAGSLDATGVAIANGATVDISQGASLTGNLVNGGALDILATSSDALQVTGDFTQTSDGILVLSDVNPIHFDQLVVSGDVNLAGSLTLNQTSFTEDDVRLIDGGTGLNGTFDGVVSGLIISQELVYDTSAFDVLLATTVNDIYEIDGLTDPDDISVAADLIAGLQGDTLSDGFELIAFDIGLIDTLPALESALTELRPEVAIGGLEVFRSSQNLFLNRLANENGTQPGQTRSVETAALGDTLYAPVQKMGEQVWGQIQYVYHEQDGTGSNPDYYANSYELAAGVSNLALGDVSFGFAVGYADIETDERVTAPDSSKIKVFRAGMTASADMNPSDSGLQAHIDGMASWAAGTHDISMNLVIPAAGVVTAQSTSTDINYVGAGLRLTVDGYDDNDWMLKPHIMVAWDNVHQDQFTIGSGLTAFTAESGNFDRTTFGYGVSMNHKWNDSMIINASVSGYHYVGDTRIGLTSQFGQNSNSSSSFMTTGENIRNQYVVEAGIEKTFGDGWTLSADGFAEFGDLEAVGGLLKLRKKF